MIEDGPGPGGRGVAQGAVGGESGGGVIRVGRSREIALVATVAIGGYRSEVASDVAEVAGHGDVEAGQGELRLAVVERGRLPSGGGVAGSAGGGETQQGVFGIGGGVEIFDMTGGAIGGGVVEVSPDVAGVAQDGDMGAGEGKDRFVVIEGDGGPSCRRVAARAGGGNAGLDMVGVGGGVEILEVAGGAVGGGSLVVVVQVAAGAEHGEVEAGQGEQGLVVIKRGGLPGGGGVAQVTRLWEARGDMVGIGRGVEVLQVARDTGSRQPGIDVVHMAGGAGRTDVGPGQRKGRFGMIEGGPGPGGRGVAQGAVGGESGGGVIRVGRSREIALVATVAIGGYRSEVASDVAEVAGHGAVEAGQGELRLAVVERGRLPSGGGVAGSAGGGENQEGGFGVGGGVEIFDMTGGAIGGGVVEVSPDVAGVAQHGDMGAGEGKDRFVVIEGGGGPSCRRVAARAGGGNGGLDVLGVGGGVEILEVAGGAVGGGSLVVVVQVAAGAEHGEVEAGQGEQGLVVIKRGGLPGGGGVAQVTRLWEARGDMVGIGRGVEVLQVARDTGSRQPGIDVVHMAGGAGRTDVGPGQRKGRFGMIEGGPGPGGRGVAQGAVGGESGGGVIRVGRSREIALVATVAIGGYRSEVASDVAEVAGHGDVEAGQ